MHNLSSDTINLLNRYEAQLCALEISIQGNRARIATTCQEEELFYIDQHFKKMLDNIASQKMWCRTLYTL